MSILEKQAAFGQSFFDINQKTLQEIAQIQQENVKNYFALNSDFSQKLPEVRDVSSFLELQREYSEQLWNGVLETTRTQADVLKSAAQDTGEAFRTLYSEQSEA